MTSFAMELIMEIKQEPDAAVEVDALPAVATEAAVEAAACATRLVGAAEADATEVCAAEAGPLG